MFDLNPLDVLKQRKVKNLPVHFSKTIITEAELFDNKLEDWIKVKLKGRYCITRHPSVSQNGQLKSTTFAAFEDQKELTYFMLACPHLRRN